MIERFEPTDAHDRRLVPGLGGLLGTFNAAGVLTAADVHTAVRLGELVGEDDERLRLGVALAVRAARHGSVCVDLTGLADGDDLPWPDPDGWTEDLAASAFAGSSVVRVEHDLVYLDRYWREEGQVRDDLVRRAEAAPPQVDATLLAAHAERLFPGAGSADQRAVALAAAQQWTTVLTGGPGTGKTTTVAGLLSVLAAEAASGPDPRELRTGITCSRG
ncbi:AAA family ATPase, partial [uncultured Nocardioides sp.]|uniref:AAA family ATPase n=1 Tax=uncultured Nocardioides sp. TaxID=198441 RepID=UPI0032B2A633